MEKLIVDAGGREEGQALLRAKRARLMAVEKALIKRAQELEALAAPLRKNAGLLQAQRLELERFLVKPQRLPAYEPKARGGQARKPVDKVAEARKLMASMSADELAAILQG